MNKRDFFDLFAGMGKGLSFDDVRLKTGYSEVDPALVNISTLFSRRVGLKCPIVSAPMDAVTESRMAIAMALVGGLGIIHRNFTSPAQVAEVVRVKTYLNALIQVPVCVHEDQTMKEIENERQAKKYGFYSFPVLDREGNLIGLLTEDDFAFCVDYCLTVGSVMKQELVTAPVAVSIEEVYVIMQSSRLKALPLVDGDGKLNGMYVFSDVKRIRDNSHEGYNIDPKGHLLVGAAIGVGDAAIEQSLLLADAGVDVLVIDTAHGDSLKVFETLKSLKQQINPRVDVVVGNISEGDSAKRLIEAGADGIKVGQGPGSICITRIIAGIGCPQLTAIDNCASAIVGSGVPIIADGGINNSGDITIAIAAGAYCVMMGRLLAGTEEAPGDVTVINGITYKPYRGMGSLGAMRDSDASRQRYGDTGKDAMVPEGVEGFVPYQGTIQSVLQQHIGGFRRGLGYVGAANIDELQEKAELYLMSESAKRESHPHDISMISATPNYPGGGQ